MSTKAAPDNWRTSLGWSAFFRAAGVSIIVVIPWPWLSAGDGLAWKAVSLLAVLALAALVGVAWYLSRARGERQWRAALDRYAEQELAKGTYTLSNSGH
jgi:hypothetical protein